MVERLSEAKVKDFGVFQDTELTSHHFNSAGVLVLRPKCESNTKTSGFLGRTRRQDSECVTLTKDFCAEINRAFAAENLNDQAIADCQSVLDRAEKAWRKLATFAKDAPTYRTEAGAEK